MSVIKLLDKQVAELIAAGEVVERPASVIKELVENSIDAGSKKITVEIKHGGITYMRVTDDGCGISREDVHTAFLRHATSKVLNSEDLNSIGTLGFRGEALASVCAVSRVELLTKTKDEPIGTSYSISGGENESTDDAGCPDGTTIVVRDLFFNTPARMKFLKKDVTEGIAVSGIIDKIALSRPDISFRYIRDGEEVFFTNGDGDMLSCIRAVCGREFASSLIQTEYSYENLSVKGYISKPTASRKNRSKQFFFINGRYVKSLTAMSALEEAYKNSIMTGKFPSCVLNIEMPLDFVDVNVHPSKTEVRFSNEKPVFYVVYYGAKSALEQKDRLFDTAKVNSGFKSYRSVESFGDQVNIEEIKPQRKDITGGAAFEAMSAGYSKTPAFESVSLREPGNSRTIRSEEINPFKNASVNIDITVDEINETNQKENDKTGISKSPSLNQASCEQSSAVYVEKEEIAEPEKQSPAQKPVTVFDYRIIGEVFNTYIICQVNSDIVFLDKHAAHERIIYNSLKKELFCGRQMLLSPITVELSKEEYSAVLSNLELIEKSGFDAEDFGLGKIIVRAVPSYLCAGEVSETIEEIAGYLLQNKKDVITEKLDWIYHSIACRAAVKGGNYTGEEDNENIVKTVFESNDILYCPHGRPVIFKLSQKEIERRFGRIQ